MVREQAGTFVFVIVVKRDLLAGGVGEPQHGIERSAEAAGENFGDDFLAGFAFEAKDIFVAGAADAAVDGDGEGEFLRGVGAIVGFDVGRVGQRVERDAGGIGELVVAAHRDEKRAGALVLGVEGQLRGRQIPTGELERGALAAGGAEGIDARDEGQFTDGDAVDEVFAAPVDRILDFNGIGAVGGDVVTQDGVGVEAVVVGVSELTALSVVDGERGLKPTRHGVGEIRNEGAGVRDHHDALAFFRGEAEAVDFAGEDLAVYDGG